MVSVAYSTRLSWQFCLSLVAPIEYVAVIATQVKSRSSNRLEYVAVIATQVKSRDWNRLEYVAVIATQVKSRGWIRLE